MCLLQVEGESEDQAATDQTSATKTKSIFIAQNVASLQELGENQLSGLGPKKKMEKCLSSVTSHSFEWEETLWPKGFPEFPGDCRGDCGWNCRDELSVFVFGEVN